MHIGVVRAVVIASYVLTASLAGATSFEGASTGQSWGTGHDTNGDGIPIANGLWSGYTTLLGAFECYSGGEWEIDPDPSPDCPRGQLRLLAESGWFACQHEDRDGVSWGSIPTGTACPSAACLNADGLPSLATDADGNIIANPDCVWTFSVEQRLTLGTGMYEGATGAYVTSGTSSPTYPFSDTSEVTIAGDITLVGGDPPNGAMLEVPAEGSTMSGIGLVSGWSCLGGELSAEFRNEDGDMLGEVSLAHGTPRGDTEEDCGDVMNGFSATMNWNLLPAGAVSVALIRNGEEVGVRNFSVRATDAEFIEGQWMVVVPDFPMAGQQATVEWDMAQQRFVVKDVRGTQ